uniref:Uncharacterized protein n=1 Tax=Hucho hucho TaxID=62062 RepID=A0A4W5JM36_9TELE
MLKYFCTHIAARHTVFLFVECIFCLVFWFLDDFRFNIQFYRNNDIPRGRAPNVYMVCCKNGNQKGVSGKPFQSLAEKIGCSHEAVFFMELIPGTTNCRLQSSLSGQWYLSFEAGPDAELVKLVLREFC